MREDKNLHTHNLIYNFLNTIYIYISYSVFHINCSIRISREGDVGLKKL